MQMKLVFPLALSLAACGGEDLDVAGSSTDEAAAAVRVTGTITTPDGPWAGAYVIALDASGRRIARVTTSASGTYDLPLSARPAALEVKGYRRVPRTYRQPALRTIATNRYRFDANVGPPIGADSTGENLTFMTTSDLRVVPQIAWGNGGALDPPLGELADLTVGPRSPALGTMIAANVRVPLVETSVIPHPDHLEVRFSRELNQHNLGSAYLYAMIQQIVATASHNYSEEALPVRIRVACASCAGGFEPLRDGAVGPTGPSESYENEVQHPGDAFRDTYGHRFQNHMAMAKALGIATGYGDGRNYPDRAVTRGELAAMLVKALGLTLIDPATPSYSDVPRTYWAYKQIETARVAGFISGGSDGRFLPTAGLTRAELAAFVVNAAKWPLAAPAGPSFGDVPSTYWAYRKIETAFGWCHALDYASDDDSSFAPARAATRAEAIAASTRMSQCLVN